MARLFATFRIALPQWTVTQADNEMREFHLHILSNKPLPQVFSARLRATPCFCGAADGLGSKLEWEQPLPEQWASTLVPRQIRTPASFHCHGAFSTLERVREYSF